MSGDPRVSIVIVTWNSRSVIIPCLDALAADPSAAGWEVVVVDNASTDGTLGAVREHDLDVHLIVNDANRGLAAANNQGIRSSSAPFVLLANPDTMVKVGAIDALVGLLERRPRAAFANPLLRYPDGRPQTSAGDLPTLSEALKGRQAQPRGVVATRGFWWDGWAHDVERRIGRGHESCYLVRRAAIEKIGLQDEGVRARLGGNRLGCASRRRRVGDLVHARGRGRPRGWGQHQTGAHPLDRRLPPRHVPLLRKASATRVAAAPRRADRGPGNGQGRGGGSRAGDVRPLAPELNVRILHVIEAIEAGVARHVTDVVCLVPAEHEVLVPPVRTGGFTDHAAFEAMEAAGAHIHLTPMRRSVTSPRNLRAVITTRRLIGSRRPDVVHGHASVGGAVARLAAARTRSRCAYTPNGLLPSRGVIAAERLLARLTDALIAVSPSEAEQIQRLRVAPADRVTVIANGIDLDREPSPIMDLRKRLSVGEGVPLVGTVGRLAEQKAPEIFVRACGLIARASDARFVMIGDGPLRDTVADEVRAAGIGDRFLHVPGMLDASSVMSQLDVFALPSRYEAGPYAPLEAMRAGAPVVLTDVIGNRDTVVDGASGLLVHPDDPAALASAVSRILSDPGLAERLRAGAHERLAASLRFPPNGRAARRALRGARRSARGEVPVDLEQSFRVGVVVEQARALTPHAESVGTVLPQVPEDVLDPQAESLPQEHLERVGERLLLAGPALDQWGVRAVRRFPSRSR